jgi:N4-gp56 family major capsid protein
MHITSESVKAANEMTEDQLQIDLLNGAGTVRFTGSASSVGTLTGGTADSNAEDTVKYDDLVKLSIELDNNRTSKSTKVITGSRMVDTKVVNAARYAYIGSELIPSFMRMVDYHDEKAFLPVAQYGAAGTIARGEQGAVHDFRIVVVPEMMHWDAVGADVGDYTDEVCMWSTDSAGQEKVNVYPILVIGDGSFTTVGFQTDGKTVKFTITHKGPGKGIANRDDPYGEIGFYSIKWYYGFMLLRPERLALMKTVAEI